jgi:hypothetical protein
MKINLNQPPAVVGPGKVTKPQIDRPSFSLDLADRVKVEPGLKPTFKRPGVKMN